MKRKSDESTPKVPIEFEAPVEELGMEEPVEQGSIDTDIEVMQTEIEALRKSVEEAESGYIRVLADFDNFRKRQRDETARLANCAREDLVLKLLPIVDNFDRALAAAADEHSYESLVEGVSLTLKQIREMLQREGLEAIDATGQQFDPEFHEALMRVETDEYPENTVIDELEKGYTLNGKLLRPARVRVAAKK